jgi:hypothetical protein
MKFNYHLINNNTRIIKLISQIWIIFSEIDIHKVKLLYHIVY